MYNFSALLIRPDVWILSATSKQNNVSSNTCESFIIATLFIKEVNTMQGTHEPKNNLILPIGITLVVLGLIAGGYVYTRNTSITPTPTPDAAKSTQMNPTNMMMHASSYKDGNYSATGSYNSPGGTNTVTVSLTLKGGIVTDSTVTGSATRGDSSEYQAMFIDNYKSQVTGRSIDSLSLTKVSGSSLTPQGFNDAVEKIKAEAKA